jgi:lysophospholipase L1-like esterase
MPSAPAGVGLRFLGRALVAGDTTAEYAWSGAGFAARFHGTGLSVEMTDHGNVHAVVVDGQPLPPLVTQRGVRQYVLAEGLANGEHVLEVTRRTEASFGVTQVHGVKVHDGQLLTPPPAKARQIEILGDSISAGYGNEGSDTSCPFSAATQNHAAAYGAVLARELEADSSTVAWSGRGVVKNYAGEAGTLMPELYLRTLPEREASRWPFARGADLVIVNLGTNDFSTEPDPDPAVFQAAYLNLLERVRERNPGAFILCTVGPMLGAEDLARAAYGIGGAVGQRQRQGDERVAYHALRTPNAAPGCDWHPSVATHARIAAELAVAVRKLLRW